MRHFQLGLFLCALSLVACGSGDKDTSKDGLRVLPQLSQEQKAEFMAAVIAEMRVNSAVDAQFSNAGKPIIADTPTMPIGDDPIVAEMSRLMRANCVPVETSSQQPDGTQLKARVLQGNLCPVSMNSNEEMRMVDKNGGTQKGNFAYQANDADFKRLSDVVAVSTTSGGNVTVSGDEGDLRIGGSMNSFSSMQSTRYGTLASSTGGGFSWHSQNGKILAISLDLTHTLDLPTFPGELRVLMSLEGEAIRTQIWINGEEIPVNGVGQGPRRAVGAILPAFLVNAAFRE